MEIVSSAKMTILGNGFVGIGENTNVPLAPLHIKGPTEAFPSSTTISAGIVARLQKNGAAAIMDIGSNGTSGFWLQPVNQTNYTTYYPLLLNPLGGNIGIGTLSPTSILHTVATGTMTTAYTGNLLTNTATSSTANINKIGLDVQSTGSWSSGTGVNTGLNVNASGGATNYAAIFQGGKVGICTTAPSYTLDVSGSLGASGTVNFSNLTASSAVFTDASKNLVSVATTGTGNVVLATTPTITTSMAVPHIIGSSATPTYTLSTGAGGVGASASLSNATDLGGKISVTTNGVTFASQPIITIGFSSNYSNPPTVILTPANAATSALTGGTVAYVSTTANGNFVISASTTALTTGITYAWYYHCIQ